MQLLPRNSDTIAKIARVVQSLRLWTLTLVAAWVKFCGGRDARIDLRRQVRELRHDTRAAFMIAIVARMRIFKGSARRTTRPRSSPHGARYQQRCVRWLRLNTRGIKLDTLEDIRAALENFDALVARASARLPKRLRVGALVMACDITDLRAALCDAHEALAPDTS